MPMRDQELFDELPSALNLDVNPYVKELIEATQQDTELPARYGPFLRGFQGNWQQYFVDRQKPKSERSLAPTAKPRLILEIGVHKGRSMIAMAKAHPELAFVGVDITFKRVVTTARKCMEAQ